jgi:hypothetical protein
MAELYYVWEEPACLPAGTILQLSEAQVSVRAQHLQALSNDWFVALAPLYFKVKEVITLRLPLETALAFPFTPPDFRKPRN